MRLLVMSDTHGNIDVAERALKQVGGAEAVDMVIHAGDHMSDATRLHKRTGVPVMAVHGNRDFPITGSAEEVFDADGVCIYVVHGHQFSVKSRITGLETRAQQLAARVVIYGHTHVPDVQWLDGRLYINPGSLYRPRGDTGKTFAILQIDDGVPSVTIETLQM